MNMYAYAGNDPINARDPSGLFCAPSRITSCERQQLTQDGGGGSGQSSGNSRSSAHEAAHAQQRDPRGFDLAAYAATRDTSKISNNIPAGAKEAARNAGGFSSFTSGILFAISDRRGSASKITNNIATGAKEAFRAAGGFNVGSPEYHGSNNDDPKIPNALIPLPDWLSGCQDDSDNQQCTGYLPIPILSPEDIERYLNAKVKNDICEECLRTFKISNPNFKLFGTTANRVPLRLTDPEYQRYLWEKSVN